MELTKNIFFNTDKLIENTDVKISYTGKFFQDNSEEVFIHYGFGLNWDNINDMKMEKTELGFQAEIHLCEGETFNFCFRNNNNEWDNNDAKNYIFNLEEKQTELLVLDDEPVSLGSARKLRKSLAKELGPSNIRVNSIAPGIIDTEMNKHLSLEELEYIKEEIPLQRIGKVNDIEKCVEWLIEDDYITGQIISINGGWSI